MERKLGWHILRTSYADTKNADGLRIMGVALRYPLLPHGDNREVRPGGTLSIFGRVVLCVRGLHAARTPWTAWKYVHGSYLCWVSVSGDLKQSPRGEAYYKFCGRRREVLWMVQLSKRDQKLLNDIQYVAADAIRPRVHRRGETRPEFQRRKRAYIRKLKARFFEILRRKRRMK